MQDFIVLKNDDLVSTGEVIQNLYNEGYELFTYVGGRYGTMVPPFIVFKKKSGFFGRY